MPNIANDVQRLSLAGLLCCLLSIICPTTGITAPEVQLEDQKYTLTAGHSSLQNWLLPPQNKYPSRNSVKYAKLSLGEKLFFDPGLSSNGNLACSSCHNPQLGWSDSKKTAIGFRGMILQRATPTLINISYNPVQNWDGRNETLEDQALEPILNPEEMNMHIPTLLKTLSQNSNYKDAFKRAFPKRGITAGTVAEAIATFERTIISNNSRFDEWIVGDKEALTPRQIQGFAVFLDPEKGNCAGCHSPPNFTDSSFHNIGLASKTPDMGRFKHLPLRSMWGAFKTPTLRNINETAPYFHDGSAANLLEVIKHYQKGGIDKTNLSPEIKPLQLNDNEVIALKDFLTTLTGTVKRFTTNPQIRTSN